VDSHESSFYPTSGTEVEHISLLARKHFQKPDGYEAEW